MVLKLVAALAVLYALLATAWVVNAGRVKTSGEVELLNVACDPTRELWRDVNEHFVRRYELETGQKISIRQSHGGSGSQARAVVDGLDADVVTLALWTDTDAVRKAGRLQPDWETKLPNRSLPYTSTIVFVVRKGNPKQVRDWPDLAKPDVACVVPNPKTSGNGKWAYLAAWGSVTTRGGSAAAAEEFVADLFRRAPVLDASARNATVTFKDKKIGDVHLTWENEAYLEVAESKGELEIIYPPVSVLAEPHVAVVDAVVDRKGTRAAAEAYMKFLYTDEAQELAAKHYYRPTNPIVAARTADRFPAVKLFRVTAVAADWAAVTKQFFADGAAFDRGFTRGPR